MYGPTLFFYNNDPNKPIRKLFVDRILQESLEFTSQGCQLWLGSLGGFGQPQMNITYKLNSSGNVSVPRLMFQYKYGAIDKQVHIYKGCFTATCVNPLHYYTKRRLMNGG